MLCKQIMEWVYQQIQNNQTEEAIVHALDTVCDRLLPVRDRASCRAYVEAYATEIIQAVMKAETPEKACVLLKECPSVRQREPLSSVHFHQATPAAQPKEGLEVEGSSPEEGVFSEGSLFDNNGVSEPVEDVDRFENRIICSECRIVAQLVQQELFKTQNEEAIDRFVVENICENVGNFLEKETCKTFVGKYGENIIKSIAKKYFEPSVFCQSEVKVCAPEVDFELNPELKQSSCNLCLFAVNQLDSLLTNQRVDAEIARVVARVCGQLLDKSQSQECSEMVTAYAPYFLQLIGRVATPRDVCKSVDLCLAPNEPLLLGGHKCTFGPTYWCQTSAHAQACKATNYCTRKAWTPIQ
jgi:saposin